MSELKAIQINHKHKSYRDLFANFTSNRRSVHRTILSCTLLTNHSNGDLISSIDIVENNCLEATEFFYFFIFEEKQCPITPTEYTDNNLLS